MPTSRTALPVSSASMNPAGEMAYLEYDPTRTDPEALLAVLKCSGFAPADRVAVRLERQSARVQKVPSQGGSV